MQRISEPHVDNYFPLNTYMHTHVYTLACALCQVEVYVLCVPPDEPEVEVRG